MLFFDFFYEMLTRHYIIPVSTEQNKSLAAVKEVLDHISLHYQENLTVSELSGLSNYSEYYFMKLFRQYTGKTLVEYINDCHERGIQQYKLFYQEIPAGK